MSVNIFGGARNGASTSYCNVGTVGIDRNFNQRLIMLSNKLAQKVNKSGDTMEGDLKLKFKTESTCVFLSLGVDGIDRNRSMSLFLGHVHNQIHHANNAPIAQHGFNFKCSADRTTSFEHDFELSDKHITGVLDPVYAIEENSSYTYYIIPNLPSITGTVFIILPISVNKDVGIYRVINNSSSTLILQSRGSKNPDNLFNLFTIKKKCLVNVEYQPDTKSFANVGSKPLSDIMFLQ